MEFHPIGFFEVPVDDFNRSSIMGRMNDLNPNMIRALKSLLPNSIRDDSDVLMLDSVGTLLGKNLPVPFHVTCRALDKALAPHRVMLAELRLHLDKLLVESTK